MQNGMPEIVGVPGMVGIPGNPGHLVISFYLVKNKSSQIVHIELRENFNFELKAINTKIEVDLQSGDIELKQTSNRIDDSEIESLLASVFSIAIIHVML